MKAGFRWLSAGRQHAVSRRAVVRPTRWCVSPALAPIQGYWTSNDCGGVQVEGREVQFFLSADHEKIQLRGDTVNLLGCKVTKAEASSLTWDDGDVWYKTDARTARRGGVTDRAYAGELSGLNQMCQDLQGWWSSSERGWVQVNMLTVRVMSDRSHVLLQPDGDGVSMDGSQLSSITESNATWSNGEEWTQVRYTPTVGKMQGRWVSEKFGAVMCRGLRVRFIDEKKSHLLDVDGQDPKLGGAAIVSQEKSRIVWEDGDVWTHPPRPDHFGASISGSMPDIEEGRSPRARAQDNEHVKMLQGQWKGEFCGSLEVSGLTVTFLPGQERARLEVRDGGVMLVGCRIKNVEGGKVYWDDDDVWTRA
eukprot:TRINITY_DN43401_c0_g1_i1.p1 TRINITY_DN43401_c0_g1~~TRINITY_DN43401_c0_g1_i1.p1  ORF type:complete len:381 (+),score=113.57 TRINITY_DN43401_c0_g1_i1:57-1145(+)